MSSNRPPVAEAWQQPPVVFSPLPYPGRAPASGGTRLATASLVLGIVALVVNLLLVPTILAITFGAVGLAKGTAARGRAITGIVLGAVGILAIGVQAAVAIPVFLGIQHRAIEQRIPAAIVSDAATKGVSLSDVRCDPLPVIRPGVTTTCTATEPGIGPVGLLVRLTDSSGGFEYRVDQTE